jgi:hypothetical protein
MTYCMKDGLDKLNNFEALGYVPACCASGSGRVWHYFLMLRLWLPNTSLPKIAGFWRVWRGRKSWWKCVLFVFKGSWTVFAKLIANVLCFKFLEERMVTSLSRPPSTMRVVITFKVILVVKTLFRNLDHLQKKNSCWSCGSYFNRWSTFLLSF